MISPAKDELVIYVETMQQDSGNICNDVMRCCLKHQSKYNKIENYS